MAHLQTLGGTSSNIASFGGGARASLPFAFHLDIAGASPLPGAARPGARLLVSLTHSLSLN